LRVAASVERLVMLKLEEGVEQKEPTEKKEFLKKARNAESAISVRNGL